jgi:excisionase family DNA binding protein
MFCSDLPKKGGGDRQTEPGTNFLTRKEVTTVVEIPFEIMPDASLAFHPDDFSRLMDEQAKPQRYGRSGVPDPEAEMLSPDQVGRRLGRSPDTIVRMIEEGKLRAERSQRGKKTYWYIPKKEVQRYINSVNKQGGHHGKETH